MIKKTLDTAKKTGMDAAKTASKRVIQKNAEANGDLIGNKQLIKLLQQVNQKKTKKVTFHQKKDNKLLVTINCFEHKT